MPQYFALCSEPIPTKIETRLNKTARPFPDPDMVAGRTALTTAEITNPRTELVMAVINPFPISGIFVPPSLYFFENANESC